MSKVVQEDKYMKYQIQVNASKAHESLLIYLYVSRVTNLPALFCSYPKWFKL
jgi:hypothetical protein